MYTASEKLLSCEEFSLQRMRKGRQTMDNIHPLSQFSVLRATRPIAYSNEGSPCNLHQLSANSSSDSDVATDHWFKLG